MHEVFALALFQISGMAYIIIYRLYRYTDPSNSKVLTRSACPRNPPRQYNGSGQTSQVLAIPFGHGQQTYLPGQDALPRNNATNYRPLAYRNLLPIPYFGAEPSVISVLLNCIRKNPLDSVPSVFSDNALG